MIFLTVFCLAFLIISSVTHAQSNNKAWDEAQAIERDSQNAQKEAEKGNYEGAREEAGKGFDYPTNPREGDSNYTVPEPGEPVIDNE